MWTRNWGELGYNEQGIGLGIEVQGQEIGIFGINSSRCAGWKGVK